MPLIYAALLSLFTGKSRAKGYHANHPESQPHPSMEKLSTQTLVVDVEGGLLRSSTTFPYFMLVALEAGGFLRGLLLLFLYPLLCCLSVEVGLKVMVMVSFCGIREKSFRAGRAVLPKFFLEDVGLEGFEALEKGGRRVCVSRMPRVMVEGFLKEYLEVEVVLGSELKVFGGFFTGLMEKDSKPRADSLVLKDLLGEKEFGDGIIGFGGSSCIQHHIFSHCKEIYVVGEADKKKWQPLPRGKYPRPLVFHDGRIAFRPTPRTTLAMFMWLPIGIPLAILRLIVCVSLPYKASTRILASTGMKWRLKETITLSSPRFSAASIEGSPKKAHLYVCNHRTLIDPIYVSIALNRPVSAVCYSLSTLSELLSPIKTVRLTRNREEDGKRIANLLSQGDPVVVCPEGTTCREPYLLRFSPLFAELSDEVVPVAINVHVSMFYATTAGGHKCLDPFYYLMNPSMCYELEFLEKVDTGGMRLKQCTSIDMANHVQGQIGRALGFECTMLTRKDKYLMLAGNDGTDVARQKNLKSSCSSEKIGLHTINAKGNEKA